MNVNALRTWGIAVSAAMIAASLAVAAQPAPRVEALQLAQAEQQAAPLSFLVRFRGAGPIARAQRAAGQGETEAAQRQVEVQLGRQRDFAGLCFDRFTIGAAEVVLRTCEAIVPSERADMQQEWLTRLRAMRAVEYVDANAPATQGRAG